MALYGPHNSLLPEPPESRVSRLIAGVKAFTPRLWKLLVGNQGINAIIVASIAVLGYLNRDKIKQAVFPVKSLSQSVDLSDLERRYPFGFLIFRNGALDSRYETFDVGTGIWDIDWNKGCVTNYPGNQLQVILPINMISNPITHSVIVDLTLVTIVPKKTHVRTEMLPFRFTKSDPNEVGLYFEIMDENQRRPIYLLGFRQVNSN